MCVGKNSAQAANVRRSLFGCAVRCSGLYLFEKMLAFLREPADKVGRLKPPATAGGFLRLLGPGRQPWAKAVRTKSLTSSSVSKQAMATWLPIAPERASGMRV